MGNSTLLFWSLISLHIYRALKSVINQKSTDNYYGKYIVIVTLSSSSWIRLQLRMPTNSTDYANEYRKRKLKWKTITRRHMKNSNTHTHTLSQTSSFILLQITHFCHNQSEKKNSKRPNKTSDPLGKENSRARKKSSMKINPTERHAEKK